MTGEPTIKQKILAALKGKEGKVFKRHEIVDMVLQKFPGTNKSSVMPSDCCYNRVNKGIAFDFHVLESLGGGAYKILGENYPYNGPVNWKRVKVGEWKDGKRPTLEFKDKK